MLTLTAFRFALMSRYGFSRSIQLTCADAGSALRINSSIWRLRFCSSATAKFCSSARYRDAVLTSLITAMNICSTIADCQPIRGRGHPPLANKNQPHRKIAASHRCPNDRSIDMTAYSGVVQFSDEKI